MKKTTAGPSTPQLAEYASRSTQDDTSFGVYQSWNCSRWQLASATDPTYAAAHAGLAGVLIETPNTLGGPDSKRKALEEARRAIALDPGLPLAYATLILYYRDAEMDWAKARAACADSVQKFPNSAQILVMCASVEGILLDRAHALQLARRAVAIDPLSPRMHGFLMFFLYQNGEFDEALKEADFAIQRGPSNAFLYRHQALILAAKGDPGGGLKAIDDARARFGGVAGDWQPVRGYLLGLLKRRSEAEHLIGEYSKQGAPPLHIGLIYLGMGLSDARGLCGCCSTAGYGLRRVDGGLKLADALLELRCQLRGIFCLLHGDSPSDAYLQLT